MAHGNTFTYGGFDALSISDGGFTVVVGDEAYTFETTKDEDGRIISVNGHGKNRAITYGTYTVTFFCGGASGTPPDPITQNIGQETIIPGSGDLSYADYFFDGWKAEEAETVYYEGNTPRFPASVDLVAQWISLEGGEDFSA